METEEVDILLVTDNDDGTYTVIEMTTEQAELMNCFLDALRMIHPLMMNENNKLVRPTLENFVKKSLSLHNIKNEA